MMFALKYIGVLRVSKAGELEGLDLHEHGAVAYPEYALVGVGTFPSDHNGNADGRSASSGEMASITIAEE
jgi:hypothetical protein